MLLWLFCYTIGKIIYNHYNVRTYLDTNQNKSFGVYSEAHFVLNWHHIMLELNPSMDKSQHFYVVIYKGYPVY